MQKQKFLKVFLFVFLLVFCKVDAANLYLISVGDFYDQDIHEHVEIDTNNMLAHAKEIAKWTNLKLKTFHFNGDKKTPEKLEDLLKNLEVHTPDVILFYFSGHGYRTLSKEKNPWPNLYFTSDQIGIDFLDIAEILKTKRAHLKILLADCCNNVIPGIKAPKPLFRARNQPAIDEKLTRANYKKLFLQTKGQIISVACETGKFSYSSDFIGGYFTKNYILAFEALSQKLPTDSLDWDELLKYVSYQTNKSVSFRDAEQIPIYVIE